MKRVRGRPKGRRLYQYKIYLTAKQIHWLQRRSGDSFPSASSLIRTLLKNYMSWKLNHLKTTTPHSEEAKQKGEKEIRLLEECLEN